MPRKDLYTRNPGAEWAVAHPADGLPGIRVVIADIDGTIALRGDRGPYDETRVLDDAPSQNIIDVVLAMWLAGHGIILTSGRKEGCREGNVRNPDRALLSRYRRVR